MNHPFLTKTGAIRAWWSLLMVLLMAIAVGVACVGYTQHAQRQSDQRWCDLMTTLDQPQVPATSQRGRAVQQQIHQLRSELGCGRQP